MQDHLHYGPGLLGCAHAVEAHRRWERVHDYAYGDFGGDKYLIMYMMI